MTTRLKMSLISLEKFSIRFNQSADVNTEALCQHIGMMRQKEETSYRCQDYLIQIQEQKEKNIVNQKCSNITNENCSIKSDNYSDVQVVDEICRRQMVEWCYR